MLLYNDIRDLNHLPCRLRSITVSLPFLLLMLVACIKAERTGRGGESAEHYLPPLNIKLKWIVSGFKGNLQLWLQR